MQAKLVVIYADGKTIYVGCKHPISNGDKEGSGYHSIRNKEQPQRIGQSHQTTSFFYNNSSFSTTQVHNLFRPSRAGVINNGCSTYQWRMSISLIASNRDSATWVRFVWEYDLIEALISMLIERYEVLLD